MSQVVTKMIFLRNDFLNPERKNYMTCPDEGQLISDFLAEYGFRPGHYSKPGYYLGWTGIVSEIRTEELARTYVDLNLKNSYNQQLYRDYKYPNDTIHSISSAHDSFITTVEALSELVGYDVKEIIMFHT